MQIFTVIACKKEIVGQVLYDLRLQGEVPGKRVDEAGKGWFGWPGRKG